jgi:hypothetical protein
VVSDAGEETLERWRSDVLSVLPSEKHVRERNAAITATYASWYRRHPSFFKWAGVAAFASRQVGLALAPFESTSLVERVKDSVLESLGIEPSEKLALSHELDLIRQTNNMVFADVGWAHAAFAAEGGGLAAVEAGLAGQPRHALMLEGFRELERGRQMLLDASADRAAASAHIWRGNELLLEHEQSVTVQDQFKKFNRPFTILLDVVTSIDFGAGEPLAAARTISSFAAFMLAEFRWSADVTRLADRWHWVKFDVLPLWRLLDSSDPGLSQRVDRLIAAGSLG